MGEKRYHMTIDRCVCYGKTFAEILDYAEEHGLRDDLEALSDRCGFGHGCTSCLPYVREALKTGTTVFHELISESQTESK